MINVIQKIVLILKWPIGHSNYLRFNYSLSEIRSLVSYFIICIDSPTKHLKDQFNKPVIWVEHPPLKFSAGAIISKAPYFPWEDQPCVWLFPGSSWQNTIWRNELYLNIECRGTAPQIQFRREWEILFALRGISLIFSLTIFLFFSKQHFSDSGGCLSISSLPPWNVSISPKCSPLSIWRLHLFAIYFWPICTKQV